MKKYSITITITDNDTLDKTTLDTSDRMIIAEALRAHRNSLYNLSAEVMVAETKNGVPHKTSSSLRSESDRADWLARWM